MIFFFISCMCRMCGYLTCIWVLCISGILLGQMSTSCSSLWHRSNLTTGRGVVSGIDHLTSRSNWEIRQCLLETKIFSANWDDSEVREISRGPRRIRIDPTATDAWRCCRYHLVILNHLVAVWRLVDVVRHLLGGLGLTQRATGWLRKAWTLGVFLVVFKGVQWFLNSVQWF